MFCIVKDFLSCQKNINYVIVTSNPMGIGFGAIAGLSCSVQIYVNIY